MKKRINIFSKKDGTTFIEDVHIISDRMKLFFDALPGRIKKWLYEATVIVDALQKLDDALTEGQPADKAIDFILSQLKLDAHIYEAIKEALNQFVISLDNIEDTVGDENAFAFAGEAKRQIASDTLMTISKLSELDADTTTQVAVFAYKS